MFKEPNIMKTMLAKGTPFSVGWRITITKQFLNIVLELNVYFTHLFVTNLHEEIEVITSTSVHTKIEIGQTDW